MGCSRSKNLYKRIDACYFGKMNYLLFFCGLSFMAFANPARAAFSVATPTDTATGHAHLVRKLSQDMCVQLSNDHKTDFNSLTPNQAMQLTQRLFGDALRRDSTAVLAMMTAAAQQNIALQQASHLLGRDVVLKLSQSCLAALPLLARFSQTAQVQQAMGANRPDINDAEKKILQPIATHLCTQLATINAQKPLAEQTPAQRHALLNTLTDKGLTANQSALLRYYSTAQLADRANREAIGYKVVLLMVAQPSCGPLIMLLGANEIGGEQH